MHRTRADAHFERFRKSGDPRALGMVFDLTAAQLFKVAAYLARDRHRAEDLVQSTFLSAIEHTQRFEPGRPVLPWLLGILTNHARMTQREETRRTEREQRRTPGTYDPAAEAEIHELADSLEHALHELPEPYRQVLLLHLQHGLSAKEIAEVLARPAGTVRTQVVRGMELLRSALPAGFVAGTLLVVAPGHGLALVRAAVLESVEAAAPTAAVSSSLLGGLFLMKKSVAVLAILLLASVGLFVKLASDAPPGSARGDFVAASHDPAASEPQTRPLANEPAHAQEVPSSRRALASAPSRDPLAPGKSGLLVRVRWGDDHTPAENVLVYASPASWAWDTALSITRKRSSPAGEVRFTDLAPGKLDLEADRGGRRSVELRADERQEVDLEIPAGVTVTGTVIDSARTPVAGARIWVSSPTGEVTRGAELENTDAAGRFRVRSVQPGRYVSALATGRYPATSRRVPKDAKETVDLTLQVGDRSGTVRGIVYGPDEQPFPEASVVVGIAQYGKDSPEETNDSLPVICFVRTDERGEFIADGFIHEPSVMVWVRAPGCAVWKQDVVTRESRETFVTVRLRRGASVTGIVRDGAGAPVQGARVTAAQEAIEPPKNVMFSGPSWAQPWSSTDSEGRFTLSHLLPGRLKLRAQEKKEWAAASFELADGQQSVWNAVLGSGLSIAGFVMDSKETPLPGWSVWAEGGQGVTRARQVVTSSDGTFRLVGCEDALYAVSARDEKSAMHGAAVTVKDVRPGTDPVHIVVPDEQLPTCKVTGILLDPDGKPVRRESLYLMLVHMGEGGDVELAGGKVKADDGDRFVVGPVRPGTYAVSLSLDEATVARCGEHRLIAGETLDLGSIRMQKPGFVRLTVKNTEGQPLANGMFMLQAAESRVPSADMIRVAAGTARSKPMQPGAYRVKSFGGQFPMWSRDVEVRSGEETVIEVTLQRGVLRKLRYPAVKAKNTTILLTWRKGSEVVFQNASMMSNNETPHLAEQRFVPGTYEVEIRDLNGHAAKATFVVDDREESEEIFELPYPAEVRK